MDLVLSFFFFLFSFLRCIQGLFSRWGDSLQSNDHVSRYRWFIVTHWNHVRVFRVWIIAGRHWNRDSLILEIEDMILNRNIFFFFFLWFIIYSLFRQRIDFTIIYNIPVYFAMDFPRWIHTRFLLSNCTGESTKRGDEGESFFSFLFWKQSDVKF